MAQPLAKPEPHPASSFDAATLRLEEAFSRLEAAVKRFGQRQHSLKADNEKLNHLLREAEGEIARLKHLASTVSERIDRTIASLEKVN